jgi:hypothetical protein
MPTTPMSRVPRHDHVPYGRELSPARQRARLALAAAKRSGVAPSAWLDRLHADMLVAVAGAPSASLAGRAEVVSNCLFTDR